MKHLGYLGNPLSMISHNDVSAIRRWLNKNKNPNYSVSGITLLGRAIRDENIEIATILVNEFNANINLKTKIEDFNILGKHITLTSSPIFLAADAKNIAFLKLLFCMKSLDAEAMYAKKYCILSYAVKYLSCERLSAILDMAQYRHFNLEQKDYLGDTAFMLAVKNDSKSRASVLFSVCGSSIINIANNTNRTPLYVALENKNFAMAEWIRSIGGKI